MYYEVQLLCILCALAPPLTQLVEAPWLGGRMPDSGAREPGFESSTYDGAVDGDTLWRQQNKILVIVLGNKL